MATVNFDFPGQPAAEVGACDLCGGRVFVVISHTDRYGYPAPACACAGCGLVFLNPRMTGEAYARFYEHAYRPLVSAYHGRLIDAQTVQAEQRDYAEQLVRFLRPVAQLPRGARMLDIGGSTGVVSARLIEAFGLKGTLIDPAPAELACAHELGLEVLPGLVETVPLPPDAFQLIILCQTVDHLLAVGGTLEKIRRSLAPDGWFFVDIVDLRAAYLRHHRVEEAIKIDHPYYLTEATIEAYLARHGFTIHRKNYSPDYLHVGYLCRKGEPRVDWHPGAESVDRLLRELRWIQNTPHLRKHG